MDRRERAAAAVMGVLLAESTWTADAAGMAQRIADAVLAAVRPAPRHGTVYGYDIGCPCDACHEAHKRYKPPLVDDDPRHGSANGYGNLGCRCQPCRDAWASYTFGRRTRHG